MITIPAEHTILVVDDDEIDRMIIERVLAKSSLVNERCFVENGQRAIEFLDDVTTRGAPLPGLALLDVNMPGPSGFDVLKHLQEHQAFEVLPIAIMLSSSDADEDRQRAAELGAASYLVKQSGIDAFVRTIDENFTNPQPAEPR